MKAFFLFFALFLATAAVGQHRCGAETTKGTPCRLIVKSPGLRCHHHGGQTADGKQTYFCGAQTTKGTPCRMKVKGAGQRCHHHRD